MNSLVDGLGWCHAGESFSVFFFCNSLVDGLGWCHAGESSLTVFLCYDGLGWCHAGVSSFHCFCLMGLGGVIPVRVFISYFCSPTHPFLPYVAPHFSHISHFNLVFG